MHAIPVGRTQFKVLKVDTDRRPSAKIVSNVESIFEADVELETNDIVEALGHRAVRTII